LAGGIVTDKNRRQPRPSSRLLELVGDRGGNLRLHRLSQLLTVEQHRRHARLLVIP
jgi:hypothetical protein